MNKVPLERKTPSSTLDAKVQRNQEQYIVDEQLPTLDRSVFQNLIFSYLDNKEIVSFSLACRQMRELTASSTHILQRLFDAVEHGNQLEAEYLLSSNLLSTTPNILSRIFKGKTIFQVALCAGDVEMCEMMKPYFERLKNGQDLIQQQFNAIFPNGIEAHVQAQRDASFDFSDVIEAILSAPADEVQKALNKQFDTALPLHQALDTFRIEFTKVSRNEQIFNPQHFLTALVQYGAAFDRADSQDKQDLIWRQIVGFTQLFFPACWAQATGQGIYNIVKNNDKLQRKMDFPFEPWSISPFIFPKRMGYDYAWTGRGTVEWNCVLPNGDDGVSTSEIIATFISRSNNKLNKITSAKQSGHASRCVIC